MNRARPWVWRLSAGILALLAWPSAPSQAVTFGQTEVDQGNFVAVAVPRASGYYTLLVLEQRTDKKPCWRESGSAPTRIEPLLLNFNFTGICGRSTDSNGYSIRAAGQDLGMKYQLSLQKKKNDVILMGLPARSGKAKPIELGRTRGIRSGFLKIDLNSGWRFTKRTYKGKALGHVYFSRDSAPTYAVASSSSSRGQSASNAPQRPLFRSNAALNSASEVTATYLVMVVAPTKTQQAKIRAQQPSAFRTSHAGQRVMQVGTFSDRTKAESLKVKLTRQGFRVLMVTKSGSLSSLNSSETIPPAASSINVARIPVPSKKIPIGRTRRGRGVYAAKLNAARRATLPPPPPSAVGFRPQ
jgi:N-acetylmuramoyl-L-alanine amidase